jgi:hypothetical protein
MTGDKPKAETALTGPWRLIRFSLMIVVVVILTNRVVGPWMERQFGDPDQIWGYLVYALAGALTGGVVAGAVVLASRLLGRRGL